MVLIFSFLLSDIFSMFVLALSIILCYDYNILQYIYSFVYVLNYLSQLFIYLCIYLFIYLFIHSFIYLFFLGINQSFNACFFCTICYKPK